MTSQVETGSPVPEELGGGLDAGASISAAPATNPSSTVRAGLWLCYVACATVPWTAVHAGGSLRIGDVFLLLAVAFLIAADIDHRMPRFPEWALFFIVAILVVGVAHEVFPTSDSYLLQRETISGIQITRGQDVASSNVGVLIKFLIAIVGLPLMFIRARHFDARALSRSAVAFTVGSAISGVIAFTDGRGLTAIAVHITGLGAGGGRASGLTEDANYVAMTCVFSLPFVIWKLVSDVRRERIWAGVGLLTLALGIYASGSRSGGGAGVVAVLLPLALLPKYRRAMPIVALILAVVGSTAFVIVPGAGHSVLKALRLTGGQGAGSDFARSVVNDQAKRDFFRSPIDGVGLKVAGEAHIVYLQALAAGGIILFLGLVIFLGGALVRCLRLISVDPFAGALFSSIAAGAVFNAAQNALTLRVVYLPAAIAAGLPLLARAVPAEAEWDAGTAQPR